MEKHEDIFGDNLETITLAPPAHRIYLRIMEKIGDIEEFQSSMPMTMLAATDESILNSARQYRIKLAVLCEARVIFKQMLTIEEIEIINKRKYYGPNQRYNPVVFSSNT